MLVRQLKSALRTSYERQPKSAWLASCVLLLLLLVRKPKRALRTSHALLLPKRAWLTSCVLLLRQLKRACRTSYVLLLLFIQKPKRACIAAACARERETNFVVAAVRARLRLLYVNCLKLYTCHVAQLQRSRRRRLYRWLCWICGKAVDFVTLIT